MYIDVKRKMSECHKCGGQNISLDWKCVSMENVTKACEATYTQG